MFSLVSALEKEKRFWISYCISLCRYDMILLTETILTSLSFPCPSQSSKKVSDPYPKHMDALVALESVKNFGRLTDNLLRMARMANAVDDLCCSRNRLD